MIARLPRKRIQACVVGQSNERGLCRTFDTITPVSFKGTIAPFADPIQPKGVIQGSMWPNFCDLQAQNNNISVLLRNTAWGGTGIVNDWCGQAVDDTPYSMSDGVLFDPNTYLAQALAEVEKGVFDERWCFLAFGQYDATVGTTKDNYQQAMINIAEYFLANGIKIALGLSVVSTGYVDWYEDNGLAALNGAITHYSGNADVVRGGDLYTAFGKNPATSFLQSDGVHMIDTGYINAAQVWTTALQSTSFTL